MKLGISSYCLEKLLEARKMNLAGVIDWAARNGAECLELVPFSFAFETADGGIDKAAIQEARRAADNADVELANYSVLADLCNENAGEQAAAIARLKRHIDIAAELGLPRMRHDVSGFRRPRGANGVADFEKLLPQIADSAGELCEYAKARGVMTLIENHGFFANGCDRVERILLAVNNPNYGLLLDTGNIACVDENPEAGALRLAPYAKMIHLKDFYIRKHDPGDTTEFDCDGRWFTSMAGQYLRGSILHQGDLDIAGILGAVKRSGYDGPIAVEFEGMEDPAYATRVSLDNARRLWEEA